MVQGLANSGFEVNKELESLYKDNYVKCKPQGFTGNDYSINELPTSKYSDKIIENAKKYSDTAFVVIGRVGGEGYDLPLDMANYSGEDAGKHYLELQQVEIDLLKMVEKNFKNVLVILNTSNAMDLFF